MAEIVLDGLELRSLAEVHDRFAQALALPEWYGRNLDALPVLYYGNQIDS